MSAIPMEQRGATAEDWVTWDFILGLGGHLLPCVPAGPDVKVAAGSALATKIGKIPSAINHDGEAHGLREWQKREILGNEIAAWSKDRRLNLCVRLGAISGLYALDSDIEDKDRADEALSVITGVLASFEGPTLPRRFRQNSGKFLLTFRCAETIAKRIIKLDNAAKGARIELLGTGQQYVCAGTHPSGVRYQWLDGSPREIPTLTLAQVNLIWDALAKTFSCEPLVKPVASSTKPVVACASEGVLDEISSTAWLDLLNALRALLPYAGDEQLWSEVGYGLLSLKRTPVEGVTGYELWLDWSKKAPNWEEGAPQAWWEAHRTQTPRSDFRHIFTLGREHGWAKVAAPDAFSPVPNESTSDADVIPSTAIALASLPESFALNTDLCNAHRLHARYNNELLVVNGQFYHFTGTHWEKDETFANRAAAELPAMVKEEAAAARALFESLSMTNPDAKKLENTKRRDQSKLQDTLLESAPQIVHSLNMAEMLERWAHNCESRTNQRNAIEMLRALCTFDAAKMDRDPHLLNCLNGTIDLRSGELRPHSPLDLITKCAPVNYVPTAEAPRFQRFLGEIMGGDASKVAMLQRWFGYAATGETREQKVVFHVGPGGGGKGTLLRAVSDTLGNYTCTAARGLITGRGSEDRHPTEIIDLLGKRLVTAHESDQGADLREGFIKQLSGEDPLKGRAMRQDFIEFLPTHKLQLLTNYPPTVQGSDYGIWRRLVLVPYDVKFGSVGDIAAGKATALVDPSLPEALRAEREGIFAWIVAGAVEWYRVGLQVPEVIRKATDVYQSEQDRAEQFIADRCVKDGGAWVSITDLHQGYKYWCSDHGYKPLGWSKLFVELRRVVGVTFDRDDRRIGKKGAARKTVRGCRGLGLIDNVVDRFDPTEPAPPLIGPGEQQLARELT